MSQKSGSSGISTKSVRSTRNRNERVPLIFVPPRSYGSLMPYYEFVKASAKAANQTIHRTESMVSLCFRSLANFVNENNLEGLQSFIESKQVQIDDRDENGTTALMVAATKGRSNFVRELLAHGADPNAEDADNWTALLCAAKEGHLDICLQLLEHNADIEHRDLGGWTSLMWATYKGKLDVVNVLLERKADPNAHGNYHISSLLWAAGRGYVEIAEALISHGAKVNMGDKYGTTALIWASRKGHGEIVRSLLRAGANVDTAGMYSWTALLVATQGNHEEVVNLLLEHKPNVNALDKDGCSALTISCKEGYYQIATSLMNVGAYINVQDRSGDTNLIHAIKGGHRAVVEALLKKYADVDIAGKDRKTAVYMAVEKGYVSIVKMLLNANPDLEISTKDGDTCLLKAVRARNAEIVQLLLDKKAKVTAADKKGDTALHIAMRARSKAIVEILLRNPKHGHLLYRPNRAGETPYNIDFSHQKSILGQIYGARRLNTNEDNENMLGYDLYSSALADILSEPSLSMPITVGLYAKWGSGKSFLLNKLREEMKNFAKQYIDPTFQVTLLLFVVVMHIALILGMIVALSVNNWILGLSLGASFVVITYMTLASVWFASKRYDWDWPYNFNMKLTKKMNNLKLVLQILFCHPPGAQTHDIASAQPIRFYFTDQTRVSSTTGGENSVVQMLGSLYDAIESDYGSISTRLFRAFKPKPAKSSSTWRWRKLCCLPNVIIFEILFVLLLVGVCALFAFLMHIKSGEPNSEDGVKEMTLHVILITAALLIGVALVANIYTWTKMFGSLFFSQRRHLQRTISKLDTLKSEGFLQALRHEVNLMKDMVKCLDSLCSQQTRLVIIVDGLDSCEQDKVLLVLDAIHMLFSDANSPFIVILAIDPHVIAKAVEMNSRRLFSESNIGGHSYLNNMVHLPFYLQNSGLRKVKVAQQTAVAHRKNTYPSVSNEDSLGVGGRSLSARRLSSENALISSTEKLKTRKGSRKLKLSESIASSIGSNMNKIGGAQDLTKMLLTDDYFSDVNPRSMRRLMNVVYVTGRLLKAFQVDFNWYRLASWINITEQWPFRTSWIIYHYDLFEDSLEDSASLKSLYDKIRPNIPSIKDIEPLLELDRDERKFDIFLTFHRSSLLVSDLKIFLPFTINLDPYLKKVIKEETQSIEEGGIIMGTSARPMSLHPGGISLNNGWANQASDWMTPRSTLTKRGRNFSRVGSTPPSNHHMMFSPPHNSMGWPQPWPDQMHMQMAHPHYPIAPVTTIAPEILEIKLSTLNVDGVCKLFDSMEDINRSCVAEYANVIRSHNINGRVLLHCSLDELKNLLNMNFGDWEMFKVLIVSLRESEMTSVTKHDEGNKNVRFSKTKQQPTPKQDRKGSIGKAGPSEVDGSKLQTEGGVGRSKQSVMEKQVTLEDQMICGALQTLNEEACEDVLEETEPVAEVDTTDVPITFVVPPSPDNAQVDNQRGTRSRTNSGTNETDFVILQSSPIGHLHWQPISISNADSMSEQSSRCSSPSHSPERRLSGTNKPSNLKHHSNVGGGDTQKNKGKHVIIKTDSNPHISVSTKTTSVMYNANGSTTTSFQEFKNASCQTPGPNPKALRRSSTGQTPASRQPRPTSLYTVKNEGKPAKYPGRKRSQSIDVGLKTSKKPQLSYEKIHKLKEKLLNSNPEINEKSDNESTPLMSELSSCNVSPDRRPSLSSSSSKSPISPIFKPFSVKPITSKTSGQNVKSSGQKVKSICHNVKSLGHNVTSSTDNVKLSTHSVSSTHAHSELNLTDITELSPCTSLHESFGANLIDEFATPESPSVRLRTMSESANSSLLDFKSKVISASNISLYSQASQRSQGSSHLVRQGALDSRENVNEASREPESMV